VRRLQIGATEERFPVRRLSIRADLVASIEGSLAALLRIEVISDARSDYQSSERNADMSKKNRPQTAHLGARLHLRPPRLAHRVSPVVGSIRVFTLLMTVHANPLRRACSRMTSSSSAIQTQ
jgi:hypothetical protein